MSRIWCKTVSASMLERIISDAACRTATSRMVAWSFCMATWWERAYVSAEFARQSGKTLIESCPNSPHNLSGGPTDDRARLHDPQCGHTPGWRPPARCRTDDPPDGKTPCPDRGRDQRQARGHHQ